MSPDNVSRILIYRLGSIGDFVIALPCLHLMRRCYPTARIALLTNRPIESRAAPAASVLEGLGFVDHYITYPMFTRDPRQLMEVKRAIKSFAPDLLIYLTSRTDLFAVFRDFLFLWFCGVRRVVGFPFARHLRTFRPPSAGTDVWESEAHRLGRCLYKLGPANTEAAQNWDLCLSEAETAEADRLLKEGVSKHPASLRLIGLSIGTKQTINDWGSDNWRVVLDGIKDPGLGLVLIGASEERVRSQEVAKDWPGPVLNFCGQISPRLSAAVIARTELFLCHDSGPMHLASAVGTRCVAVFSKRNLPGQWFPYGTGHKVLYPPSTAESIQAIRPPEVIAAAQSLLHGKEEEGGLPERGKPAMASLFCSSG